MTEFMLSKTYDFQAVEKRLYEWWEESGFFKPSEEPDGEPYVISMPPPNVTGELHLGHAMFVALEDMMIRYQRMKGRDALWVPGTDHAGIATQLQVEKHLLKTENLRRDDIGREEFLRRTWEWKKKHGGMITNQLRRLGASCDWSRERFTLDEGLSRAVREAFFQYYKQGLIYRDSYLINWSPGLKTAVSDLEVEYTEEQGTLYYFNYPLADSDENIPVATTRPETILGDTAVAVHPEDDQYRHLIGKSCLVPILNREIPVIADDYVDREFGTGALKITPGHDPHDYEIGARHELAVINVLNEDASMNEEAGPYVGLDRYECRSKLWADMEAAGLTIRKEAYTMQVPRSQRGGEVIEPMVSTQWFVRMEPLAKPALEAVRSGKIKIIPERFTKVYYNWLENIRDWCISRQLWWGHRIPAWYCIDCDHITVAIEDPDRCESCGSTNIEQDPDVLDTWFSSGLWPFSTLGWPEKTEDLARFYPTTMMETGYDILFFWVARMIISGLAFTGEVPFTEVYLHGLVRDEQGRKMSKTLGNVIDPLEVMDTFGTDALRFTLLTGSTPGQDLNLSLKRVEANRNFANKLWNAGRLILHSIQNAPAVSNQELSYTLADRWILTRHNQLKKDVERLFNSYQYGEAGRQIYDFLWSEFADWYLEISKLQMAEGGERAWRTASTMMKVFDECLRMLHPFTPYVTEELWGHLKNACQAQPAAYLPDGGWGKALMIASWPEFDEDFEDADSFELVKDLVRSIRNIRAEKNVPAKRQIPVFIQAGDRQELLQSQADVLSTLARLDPEQLTIVDQLKGVPENAVPLVVGTVEAYLPLTGMLDYEQERERLSDELSSNEEQVRRLEKLLAGPFADKAPAEVVAREQERLQEFQETAERLRAQLIGLGDSQ
ncbi:MAG: valine--tRNA ligase [Anaerolineales bacterium]|nr:valine--tRNA ligase [Anaerolineales bacterium]